MTACRCWRSAHLSRVVSFISDAFARGKSSERALLSEILIHYRPTPIFCPFLASIESPIILPSLPAEYRTALGFLSLSVFYSPKRSSGIASVCHCSSSQSGLYNHATRRMGSLCLRPRLIAVYSSCIMLYRAFSCWMRARLPHHSISSTCWAPMIIIIILMMIQVRDALWYCLPAGSE